MQNNQQKIVLIGGPGTGKTTVLNALKEKNFFCFDEVSRAVTLKAQEKGIEQLFLTEPLLFSKMLLEGREEQYLNAEKTKNDIVFFDRGIPDVYAYLNYFKTEYPPVFIEKSKDYKYDIVFHFSPWEEIHTTDNERYESFEESIAIDNFLIKAYSELGYKIITIPFGSVDERANYIINSLSCDL
ncbi:ATPase [Polaribacter reichenbachii]|uniref:ATPase n=1 Tax=Polaribacter reichenbachii TaxID=996801 RepID=A0A1B8TRB4_9FLAO|nr:ATP-binding protein [Polaribacter reichenbachii]APZ47788.1 ATPase [Polaribacter reichenbachii]AUC18423.1 ATPase [Polaribacter reichenbachii]OBY62226.1 ATPase [Polaribacter reichenbachii]